MGWGRQGLSLPLGRGDSACLGDWEWWGPWAALGLSLAGPLISVHEVGTTGCERPQATFSSSQEVPSPACLWDTHAHTPLPSLLAVKSSREVCLQPPSRRLVQPRPRQHEEDVIPGRSSLT